MTPSSEIQHTPGPLVIDQTTGINMLPIYLLETEDGTSVARCAKHADAVLFAAAPDLLEALKAIVLPFEMLCNCGDEDDAKLQAIRDQAEAAIALAKEVQS